MSTGQRRQVVVQPLSGSIRGGVGRLRAQEEDPHQSLQASSSGTPLPYRGGT